MCGQSQHCIGRFAVIVFNYDHCRVIIINVSDIFLTRQTIFCYLDVFCEANPDVLSRLWNPAFPPPPDKVLFGETADITCDVDGVGLFTREVTCAFNPHTGTYELMGASWECGGKFQSTCPARHSCRSSIYLVYTDLKDQFLYGIIRCLSICLPVYLSVCLPTCLSLCLNK